MPSTAASQRDERHDPSEEQSGGLVPEAEPIVLTTRDWEVFLAAWDDVDRPRPQLEALIERYRNTQLSDVG